MSWAFVVLWSGITFATVPFVRDWVNYVNENLSREAFTYFVTAILIAVAVATVAALLKLRRHSVAGYVWLIGVAGLMVYLTFELQAGSPVEAVHFLQYGVLSLFLYRAFSHRVHDYSIYVAVIVTGTTVGMIDETVQWLTPRRHFGLNDIWLNFTGVALVQIAVAAGIRPKMISGWPNGEGLRRLCSLGAVAVAYLGLLHLNTPDRIAWYTTRVPLLDFINQGRGVMVEYGYFHGNAKTVLFRSRLTAEELLRLSQDRIEENARILDRYRDRKQYGEFLKIYTPVTNPFLHEVRVRLFRRDRYFEWARSAKDDYERRRLLAVVYWENRILESHFGALLLASSYKWPAALAANIREQVETDRPHESGVSRHLITAYNQRQAFWFSLSTVIGLFLLGRYFGGRAPRQTAIDDEIGR